VGQLGLGSSWFMLYHLVVLLELTTIKETTRVVVEVRKIKQDKVIQISQGSICEGWKHGMECLDPFLFTWIAWLCLWF
jgi:hypothetical protein